MSQNTSAQMFYNTSRLIQANNRCHAYKPKDGKLSTPLSGTLTTLESISSRFVSPRLGEGSYNRIPDWNGWE